MHTVNLEIFIVKIFLMAAMKINLMKISVYC